MGRVVIDTSDAGDEDRKFTLAAITHALDGVDNLIKQLGPKKANNFIKTHWIGIDEMAMLYNGYDECRDVVQDVMSRYHDAFEPNKGRNNNGGGH